MVRWWRKRGLNGNDFTSGDHRQHMLVWHSAWHFSRIPSGVPPHLSSDMSSGILSEILSDILSDIFSAILSGIQCDKSNILSDNFSHSLSDISSASLSDIATFYLANRVAANLTYLLIYNLINWCIEHTHTIDLHTYCLHINRYRLLHLSLSSQFPAVQFTQSTTHNDGLMTTVAQLVPSSNPLLPSSWSQPKSAAAAQNAKPSRFMDQLIMVDQAQPAWLTTMVYHYML